MPKFLVVHEAKQVLAKAVRLLTLRSEEFATTAVLVSGQASDIARCADEWPELKAALEEIRNRIQHVAVNPMITLDYIAEKMPPLRQAIMDVENRP